MYLSMSAVVHDRAISRIPPRCGREIPLRKKDDHFCEIRRTVHRTFLTLRLQYVLLTGNRGAFPCVSFSACFRDDDLSYSRLSTLSAERRGSLTARDRTIHRRRCVAGGGSECQFREKRERERRKRDRRETESGRVSWLARGLRRT